jgi:hypothetical protein
LFEQGGGYGIDEGCGCALLFSPMLGEGEGGVEFNPENPVGFQGVEGGDWEVVRINDNELFL